MGLFDGYQFDPSTYSGGGLLSMLNFPQPVPSAGFAPVQAAPPQDPAQAPAAPQTVDMSARGGSNPISSILGGIGSGIGSLLSPSQANAQEPGIGDRLMAGFQGFTNAQSPMQALGNLVGGLASGQRSDPQGMALARMQATYSALRAKGVPDADARAAALNPDVLKTVAGNYFDTKPQFGVIGQNQLGVNQYGFIEPNKKQITPASAGGAAPGTMGGIDPSLSGSAFLDAVKNNPTLGPGKAELIKAIADGRAPYPTGFMLKTPFGQWLVSAIGQYEPGIDANVITQRRKMQTDLAASSPNSIGGILSNGKSAFEHLAELSDKAAQLGSVNGPDIYGGGAIAHAENYIGSKFGNSATNAKIGAFNQNALKYGQESTKFYAGTGGGEAERMNALKSLNPETSSGQEQAAFLENEKGLMLDRMRQKEQQIRSIMGDAYLAQHPVMTPELQQTISRIDANIAKLRGQPAESQQTAPKVGDVQQGYRFKGGDPADPHSWEPVK